MAYIPWWQRRLAPTLAERFELGGLAGRVGFSEGADLDRYNKVRPIVNRDYNRGAKDTDTHNIVFKKSKAGTLPAKFEGTQFYSSETKANEALEAKQKFIKESKEAKKKPPVPAKKDKFLVKIKMNLKKKL